MAMLALGSPAQANTRSRSHRFQGKIRVSREALKSLATGAVIAQTDVLYLEGECGYLPYRDSPGRSKMNGRYVDYRDLRAHVVKVDPGNASCFQVEGNGARVAYDLVSGDIDLIGGSNARLTLAEGIRAIRLHGVLIRRVPVDAPDSYVTWSREKGIFAVGKGYVVGEGVRSSDEELPRRMGEPTPAPVGIWKGRTSNGKMWTEIRFPVDRERMQVGPFEIRVGFEGHQEPRLLLRLHETTALQPGKPFCVDSEPGRWGCKNVGSGPVSFRIVTTGSGLAHLGVSGQFGGENEAAGTIRMPVRGFMTPDGTRSDPCPKWQARPTGCAPVGNVSTGRP
jgi:hypothetical protein